MKKIIIEIDDKQYEDAINDTEWDTLSLGIYLKEQVKNGTPLEEELKTIRVKITACTAQGEGNFCDIHNNAIETARKVVDNRISELKGE